MLLVRDPAEVLTSLVKHLPNPRLRDTGFAVQSQLLEQLRAWGQPPLVIDAAEIPLDPAGVLASLCERLGIAFDASMLSWPAGPRAPLPKSLLPLWEECRPHYESLKANSIRARPEAAGSAA